MTNQNAILGTALTSRAPLDDVIEQAQLVESLGYRSVWLPEISGRDAFVTAAVVARHTERIRVATGVVPVPARGLSALVMAVAATAEAASARFVLGLGAGHSETASSHFGWARPARVGDVRHVIVAVRDAVREGVVRGRGVRGAVDLVLRGIHVHEPPPIIVGALRPAMARMAGECADGLLLNWATVDRASRVISIARGAAKGKEFHVASYVPVCVVDDERDIRAARKAVAHQLASYVRLSAYGDLLTADGYAEDVAAVRARADASSEARAAAVSDRLIDAVALIGDVATVQAGLRRYRSVGVDEPVVAPVAFGDDSFGSLAATWAALAQVGD